MQINATPGRSILKQAVDTGKKSSKKSIKVVLFDQSDVDIPSDTEKDQPNTSKIEKVLEAHELNFESGLSSMDIEKEEKENSRRKSHRLLRQVSSLAHALNDDEKRRSGESIVFL